MDLPALAGAPGQLDEGDKYHHIRISEDKDFDRIRTKTFGKGILARVGYKGSDSKIVSLLFDKKRWTPSRARTWYKSHRDSLASVLDDTEAFGSTYVEYPVEDVDPTKLGLELPAPTPTKAYAIFRLLSFYPVINGRHDAFDEADVDESAMKSLIGTPIYGNENLMDHFTRSGTRGPQVGAVIDAKRHPDAIYALAAFYKLVLQERYRLDAPELTKAYSVSMEVKYDVEGTRYLVNGKVLDRDEAVKQGIASPSSADDNPSNYEARFLMPVEYHGVALLHRGRNADPTADVLLTAASKENPMPDAIEWCEEDFASMQELAESFGLELTTERRKDLDRADFAYVDKDGKGHLPIHDAAHVRNALARLNQTNIPPEAKRSAFRKILAAARRFGVDIDKNSDIYKAYADMHYHSPEERRRILRMRIKRKQNPKQETVGSADTDTFEVLAESYPSVLVQDGGLLYRADLGFDDEDELDVRDLVAIGQISEVQQPMTDEEKQAQEAALKERESTVRAELEAAFKTRELEIAHAATEAFKDSDEFKALAAQIRAEALAEYHKTRETIAARMKELQGIHPFKDDADRQTVENRVTETVSKDVEWMKVKEERYQLALSASKAKPALRLPTLVAKASVPSRNIFDFTAEEQE